jgi:hypothetical protein
MQQLQPLLPIFIDLLVCCASCICLFLECCVRSRKIRRSRFEECFHGCLLAERVSTIYLHLDGTSSMGKRIPAFD